MFCMTGGFYREIDGPAGLVESARSTGLSHSRCSVIAPLSRRQGVLGRSCRPWAGPEACVIVAHDAETGEELWRRWLVPALGEPGDETCGDVPYEDRVHVGSWTAPSVDLDLNLVFVGTSVTSPASKFLRGGIENTHLNRNSTLALDPDIGEIRWYCQHLNDHWDLNHPFERLLVDTAVAPDPAAVSWINPGLATDERQRVVTDIPGKTGVVATGVPLGHPDRAPERHHRHRRHHRGGHPDSEIVFAAEG